jgi:hypothetical protein
MAMFGSSEFIYVIYDDYIFNNIRRLYDFTLGNATFPTIYLLFVIVVWLSYTVLKQIIFLYPKLGLNGFMMKSFLSFANFFGTAYFLFYFLWAFNYYRPKLEDQLSLPNIEVDSTVLLSEFKEITQLLEQERILLSSDTVSLYPRPEWQTLEDTLRELQTKILRQWGDAPIGKVRIRKLRPKGTLLSISTAGVYIPFVCEGHVDGGLHPLKWPFTLAHEMAHGYGYTDEGVCNFIGLVTCMKSNDPYIRYSGLLGYWKYIYFELKYRNEQLATVLFANLSPGIRHDLMAIKTEHDKYPDIFPQLRDAIYDFFLKFNGVDTGLDSYSEILVQVQRWKKSNYAFSFVR